MDDFDHSLPMVLNRALDAVMPPYRDLFARYDLTEPQWRVLRVVWGSDRIKSVDLSNRTLLAAASIVGIVDRLEKKGLVSRVRSTTDRRAIYITATAQSRQLQQQVNPQVEDIQTQVRGMVSAEEWAQMEQTLGKIASGLNNRTNAAAAS
jgi:homoprotocatechuate degradation regulator HpaR